MVSRVTIYIKLLEEGTDVYRPTQGEVLAERRIRLLPCDEYPDEEKWEFSPGTIVEASYRELSEGRVLVATRAID